MNRSFKGFPQPLNHLSKAFNLKPVLEIRPRYEDAWNSFTKGPPLAMEKHKDIWRNVRSPLSDLQQKQEDMWNQFTRSPVLDAMQKHDAILRNFRSPLAEVRQRQEDMWNQFTRSPVLDAMQKHEAILRNFHSPLSDLGKRQEDIWNRYTSSAILNSAQNILWENLYSSKYKHLISMVYKDVESGFDDIVDELETAYSEIEESEVLAPTPDNALFSVYKQLLEWVLLECEAFKRTLNVVDSKKLWEILSNISVVLSLVQPFVPNESQDFNIHGNPTIINIQGDVNEIHLDDSEPVIIQTEDDTVIINPREPDAQADEKQKLDSEEPLIEKLKEMQIDTGVDT